MVINSIFKDRPFQSLFSQAWLRLSCLSVLLILIAGCVSGIRYSPGELRNFPVEIQRHIQAGEVIPGMTQVQVRYAWGGPSDVIVLEPKDGHYREMWVYSTLGLMKTRLIFVDGVLQSIISGDPTIKIE